MSANPSTGLLAWTRRALLIAGAIMLVAACNRPASPPAPNTSTLTPSTPAPAADNSTPNTAATEPQTPSAAQSEQPRTNVATDNSSPLPTMSKEEESNSMPQPGQANDHSTTAKDQEPNR